MNVTVSVETKTYIRFLVVFSIFLGAVFFIWKLWPALMIIGVSFFLAVALNPPVNAISRKIPGHSRIVATAISYLIVLTFLATLGFLGVPPVIEQTNIFIDSLPQYINDLSAQRGVMSDLITQYNLQDHLNQAVASLQQQSSTLAQGVGSQLVGGVTSLLSGVVTTITILVLTFLMLIEGPSWLNRLWNLYTDQSRLERHKRLADKMYKVVSGFVNGQVLVASISALAGMAILLILAYFFNVPLNAILPLALTIFVTTLIPLIGSTIGATIITIVLLFNDVTAAIIFLVYFIVYQQIENNFIQPTIQARRVALSALSVLIALIIGVGLLGLIGGLLAIPIAGCIRAVVLDYMHHRKKKPRKKEPLFKLAKS